MKRIAVFASGNGSNFEALVNQEDLGYKVDILVCNRPNANVIKRAERLGVETYIFNHKEYEKRETYEKKIVDELKKRDIKLIVLAGYMRLFSKVFLSAYEGRIINIHPSLLPDFPGINPIQDAYDAKVSRVGVTIFYVDSGIDTGEIITQEGFNLGDESIEDLESKIHELEHRLYPKTVKEILRGNQ